MLNNKEMTENLNNSKKMVDKELKMALNNIELSLQTKPCCLPSLLIILIFYFYLYV